MSLLCLERLFSRPLRNGPDGRGQASVDVRLQGKANRPAGRNSKRWELDNAPPVWGQISSRKIAKLFSNERLFFWFLSSCSWSLVDVLTAVTRGNVSQRQEAFCLRCNSKHTFGFSPKHRWTSLKSSAQSWGHVWRSGPSIGALKLAAGVRNSLGPSRFRDPVKLQFCWMKTEETTLLFWSTSQVSS